MKDVDRRVDYNDATIVQQRWPDDMKHGRRATNRNIRPCKMPKYTGLGIDSGQGRNRLQSIKHKWKWAEQLKGTVKKLFLYSSIIANVKGNKEKDKC